MQFEETGLGLFGWHDDDIAIFGGTRTNRAHPAGHLWCHSRHWTWLTGGARAKTA